MELKGFSTILRIHLSLVHILMFAQLKWIHIVYNYMQDCK